MELLTKFNELEPKQKLTAIVTILVTLLAIYLAYDTFFGGKAAAPAKTTAKPVAAAVLPASPGGTPINGPSASVATGASAVPPPPEQKQPTPAQLAALSQSQQMQQQYINLVNAYQMAQIEQKLASANSQIAESKLSTARAMVSTQKFEAQLPQGNILGENKEVAPQAVYVGQQGGRWLAMLDIDGSYVQVNVGTRLPNGSVVSAISDKGVVLDNNGEPVYLPIARTLQ